MRHYLSLILLLTSTLALAQDKQPPNARAPKNSIPYNMDLCKTKRGEKAFSYVKIDPKFDKKGCTTPLKSWIYDAQKNKWKSVNPKSVKCCDPAAESGLEP